MTETVGDLFVEGGAATELYRHWRRGIDVVMRQEHGAGEKAGRRLPGTHNYWYL